MKHVHHPKRKIERPFSGAVESDKPNPYAHGWVTIEQICQCGARRLVNVNQKQKEVGYWREKED